MAAQRGPPFPQPLFQLPSGSWGTQRGTPLSFPSLWALGQMTEVAAVSTREYLWK